MMLKEILLVTALLAMKMPAFEPNGDDLPPVVQPQQNSQDTGDHKADDAEDDDHEDDDLFAVNPNSDVLIGKPFGEPREDEDDY